MNNLLKKVFGFAHGSIEYVRGSDSAREHLIANGRITNFHDPEIRTAVSIDGSDLEFSTNFGQLPNTPIRGAITDKLNRKFRGKFVTFPSDTAGKVDLIFTSRKPSNWINQQRFGEELEHHAKTRVAVDPILGTLETGIPNPRLDYPALSRFVDEMVDDTLKLKGKLDSGLIPQKYRLRQREQV